MQRHRPFATKSGPTQHGFSLIEVLIAIVILAVLLSLAYPSFMDSIRKGRRSEAFAAIAGLQQAQERWRTNHANYTVTLSDLSLPASTTYYDLTIAAPPSPADIATGYVVTASGRSGTSQASDANCRNLSVMVDKGSIKYAGCGSCSTFTYTPTQECWAR